MNLPKKGSEKLTSPSALLLSSSCPLLSSSFPLRPRHEEVEVEAVLALAEQPRPQVLQRPQAGQRHPVEGVGLVPDLGEALRAHRAGGRRLGSYRSMRGYRDALKVSSKVV